MNNAKKAMSIVVVLFMIGTALACIAEPVKAEPALVTSSETVNLNTDANASGNEGALRLLYGKTTGEFDPRAYWSQSGNESTLILDGVNFKTTSDEAIEITGNNSLVIVVKGENTIRATNDKDDFTSVIYSNCSNITITADDSGNEETSILNIYDESQCPGDVIYLDPDGNGYLTLTGGITVNMHSSAKSIDYKLTDNTYFYVDAVYVDYLYVLDGSKLSATVGDLDLRITGAESRSTDTLDIYYTGLNVSDMLVVDRNSTVYAKIGNLNLTVKDSIKKSMDKVFCAYGIAIKTSSLTDETEHSADVEKNYIYAIAGDITCSHSDNCGIVSESYGLCVNGDANISYMAIRGDGGRVESVTLGAKSCGIKFEGIHATSVSLDGNASLASVDNYDEGVSCWSKGVYFENDSGTAILIDTVINCYAVGDDDCLACGFYSEINVQIGEAESDAESKTYIICESVGETSYGFGINSDYDLRIRNGPLYLMSKAEGKAFVDLSNNTVAEIQNHMISRSIGFNAENGKHSAKEFGDICGGISYFAMEEGDGTGVPFVKYTDEYGNTNIKDISDVNVLKEPEFVPEGKRFVCWKVSDVTGKEVEMQPGDVIFDDIKSNDSGLTKGPIFVKAVFEDAPADDGFEIPVMLIVLAMVMVIPMIFVGTIVFGKER